MKFAKIIFWIAGIWGLLMITPLYFMFDSGLCTIPTHQNDALQRSAATSMTVEPTRNLPQLSWEAQFFFAHLLATSVLTGKRTS
jgi:hypothetical protein